MPAVVLGKILWPVTYSLTSHITPKKIQQAFTCQKSTKHQLSTLSSKSKGFGTPLTWMWVSP
jgi:hypothetical protein